MLSAENIAAIKIAAVICNNNVELKKEILCVPRSSCGMNKKSYKNGSQKQWNDVVEKKATLILEKSGIPKKLHENLLGNVFSVGRLMLTWAEYHEGILGISREYCVNFLKSTFFETHGIIDCKTAAEELINDEKLSAKQKYKLACIYCLTDHIPSLFEEMTKDDQEEFYSDDRKHKEQITHPELVKFRSHYLIHGIDKIRGGKDVDHEKMLRKAVGSGNKPAVEFCLERIDLSRRENAIQDAAVEAVRYRVVTGRSHELALVPPDYYVDVLCFLLSKIEEGQKREFLKRDIQCPTFIRGPFDDLKCSKILEYFLNWPYQSYFMTTARQVWDFLPENIYIFLLLTICKKIESKKDSFKYGEEKCYDYRNLLREFWCQSPERFKRYVFSNEEQKDRIHVIEGEPMPNCLGLLNMLLTLKKFTFEDRANIEMILDSATVEEKKNILSSLEWKNICIRQMKRQKWDILDSCVRNCSLSTEEADKFKRGLSITKAARRLCLDFIKSGNWDAVESFINWSSLPEEGINRLKKAMISSEYGKHVFIEQISSDKKIEAVDQFIRWCSFSSEEAKVFKKSLVSSYIGTIKCGDLVKHNQLELASEFINFCLSSQEDVWEFKGRLADLFGETVCEKLILGSDKGNGKKLGAKWEEAEKFLTWCFPSQQEINDFKKNKLLKGPGKSIHFELIKASQWEDVGIFYSWLGLSDAEIKVLKKEIFFNYSDDNLYFKELVRRIKYDRRSGEKVKRLLRWYLTDIETILEFKEEFRHQYNREVIENIPFKLRDGDHQAALDNFDLIIEQLLSEMDKQKMDTKRKSETAPTNKKLCN